MDSTPATILDAAVALFAARGYDGVGVQDVCLAAGITKPTLYYHFGNKRGLLVAIGDDRYRRFVEQAALRCVYGGDLQATLRATLKVFLDAARLDPAFARLRLSLAFSPPDSEPHAVMRPHTEALYAALRAGFAAAAREHGNMKGRDLLYTASFIGTADAYVGLLLAGMLDPGDAVVQRIVHHYMHGIFS